MAQLGKARISEETFDKFLAEEGLLSAYEEDAIMEIIAGHEAPKTNGTVGKRDLGPIGD